MSLSGLKISRLALIEQLEAKLKTAPEPRDMQAEADAFHKAVAKWKQAAWRIIKARKDGHLTLQVNVSDQYSHSPEVYAISIGHPKAFNLPPFPTKPQPPQGQTKTIKRGRRWITVTPSDERLEIEQTLRILRMSTSDTVNASLAQTVLQLL